MSYDEIMEKVKCHHELMSLRHTVVFTALIGSQNYGLSDEHSDIDTFSLIFPTIEDIVFAREPASGEFEVVDGKCMYKDIRLALNLLKKASPNSTEMFASNYMYFNPEYKDMCEEYLCGNLIHYMIHCNYSHMLYACAGMAHQLTKRNMPAGKRYSHALRLLDMVRKYIDSLETESLFYLSPAIRDEAMGAKRNTHNISDEWYNEKCEHIAQYLDDIKNRFIITENKKLIEKIGIKYINQFQWKLMKKYLGVENENRHSCWTASCL